MIFTQPNEEMRAQIEDAIKIVDEHHHRSSPGWSKDTGMLLPSSSRSWKEI